MDLDPNNVNIDALIADREAFNRFVYTPVEEAMKELNRRRSDKSIVNKVVSYLNSNIPTPFIEKPRAVLFRQVATPNHEIRRFMSIVELMGMSPLFWEYYHDKFVPNNEVKYYLGNILFYVGMGKKGGMKWESQKIIDFNSSNGKKISDIKTIWGEDLISFHHSLFHKSYRKIPEDTFFDASNWLKTNGGSAVDYYKNYLALFISHGVLLENVMLDTKELSFTRDIFLPAFIKVTREFGVKPIMIALEPTEIEEDKFWMSHPHTTKNFINRESSNLLRKIWSKISGLLK